MTPRMALLPERKLPWRKGVTANNWSLLLLEGRGVTRSQAPAPSPRPAP
jgi:hypothetical protein